MSGTGNAVRFGLLIISVDDEARLLAVALIQSQGYVKSYGIKTEYRYVPPELLIVRVDQHVCPCCTRTHVEERELCETCRTRLARLSARPPRRRQRSRPRSRTSLQT